MRSPWVRACGCFSEMADSFGFSKSPVVIKQQKHPPPPAKYLCRGELICSQLRLLPVTAFSAPLVCLWHLVVISVTTHQAISRDINGEPCVVDLRLVLGWGGLVRTGDAQPVKEFTARTIINLGRGGG